MVVGVRRNTMSPMEQGEEFVRATGRYRAQLQHLGVPEVLWSELWQVRLSTGTRDAGGCVLQGPPLKAIASRLQKLKRLGDDGSREEERILSSSLLTLAGPGRPHVVAAREVPADGAIWVVRHTLSEPSGHKLLSRLHADFPLLLRVAEDLQVICAFGPWRARVLGATRLRHRFQTAAPLPAGARRRRGGGGTRSRRGGRWR